MKKLIVIISFTLFTLSILVFTFHFSFQKNAYDILIGNHQEIKVILNDDTPQNEFINELQQFSERHHVNISQYTFLNDEIVHIYSTNMSNDPNLKLMNGDFPKGNEFLANKPVDGKKQSGIISSPPTQFELKFYNIDQLKNVGLNGNFYIASSDRPISKELKEAISPFGDVEIVNSDLNLLAFVNMTLLLLSLFTFIIFVVVVLFYVISENKMIYLSQLWGHTFKEVFINLLKPFLKPIFYILVGLGIILVAFITIFNQVNYIIVYSGLFLSVILVGLILGMLITLSALYMIFRLGINSVDLKGKLPFRNYAIITVIVKFVVTFLFLTITVFSINLLLDLNNQLNSNEYWKKTEDIYRINAILPDTAGNLTADRKINNKLSDLYNVLSEKRSAILIAAENFANIDTGVNETKYLYELNATEGSNPHTSSYGRNIVINSNYLDFNPIITTSGENAKDEIMYDSDTLSLLVPVRLQKYEKEIKRNFQDFFHFQRVEVANIYNEEMGNRPDNTKVDDLKVQIIYVKDNQNYFTLNTEFGDLNNNNLVSDPIAVIYQPTMDTSFIGAYVTSSLYFVDNSNGEAYSSISDLLKETDTLSYIPLVYSVYQERGQEIATVKQQMYQQMAALIFLLAISICCIIFFTWCFYIPNAYTIYLHLVFGYSHWHRNKILYSTVIITNIISGVLVYVIFSFSLIIYSSLVLLFLDIITILIFGKALQSKQSNSILKGDQL